ncbi:zf-HC2 domain-containing protein [bacterium]|nr:zf-HC2 domain-containing protein [bacterium]
MKCDMMPELLVSYLYNELEPDEIDAVKQHLETCRSCAEIYDELRESSALLSRWPDENPHFNVRFIHTRAGWGTALKSWLNRLNAGQKVLVGLPAVVCGVLLLLSAVNFRVESSDGTWHVSFSLLPGGARAQQQEILGTIDATNQRTIQLVAQMIADSEQRQYLFTRDNMAELAKQIQMQRERDLRMVGYGLEGIKETTEGKLQQTNKIVDDLARLTGYRLDHK